MNKIILSSLLISTLLYCDNTEILTDTQKNILNTKKKIIDQDESINNKDWLGTFSISSSLQKDQNSETSKNASISFEQDIFRFGAIGNIINGAKIQKQYDLLDLNITLDEYINNIYTNVLNLHLIDLQIQKQELSIKNKEISLEILKQEYNKGQTDVTTLNDAIIELNSLKEEIVNLENTKNSYKNNLRKYSNIKYQQIETPKLEIQNLETYLNNSKDLKLAQYNQDLAKIEYKIKKTDYLPKVSITSSYGNDFENTNNDDYYNYGLKVSMPIDFTSLNQTEKYKLNYLLAKQEKEQTTIDKDIEYNEIIESIKKYKSLIDIAQKDISLYDELLETVNQEYKAGYKAIEDVEILSNTKKIRQLDVLINDFYIQIQLISMYF